MRRSLLAAVAVVAIAACSPGTPPLGETVRVEQGELRLTATGRVTTPAAEFAAAHHCDLWNR